MGLWHGHVLEGEARRLDDKLGERWWWPEDREMTLGEVTERVAGAASGWVTAVGLDETRVEEVRSWVVMLREPGVYGAPAGGREERMRELAAMDQRLRRQMRLMRRQRGLMAQLRGVQGVLDLLLTEEFPPADFQSMVRRGAVEGRLARGESVTTGNG